MIHSLPSQHDVFRTEIKPEINVLGFYWVLELQFPLLVYKLKHFAVTHSDNFTNTTQLCYENSMHLLNWKWNTVASVVTATCVFPAQRPMRRNRISPNPELCIVFTFPNYQGMYTSYSKSLCSRNKICGAATVTFFTITRSGTTSYVWCLHVINRWNGLGCLSAQN